MPPRGQLTVYLKDNADAQDVAQLRVVLETGKRIRNLGWMYWFPNPSFPFIWFRVGLPWQHPELDVEYFADPEPDLTEGLRSPLTPSRTVRS